MLRSALKLTYEPSFGAVPVRTRLLATLLAAALPLSAHADPACDLDTVFHPEAKGTAHSNLKLGEGTIVGIGQRYDASPRSARMQILGAHIVAWSDDGTPACDRSGPACDTDPSHGVAAQVQVRNVDSSESVPFGGALGTAEVILPCLCSAVPASGADIDALRTEVYFDEPVEVSDGFFLTLRNPSDTVDMYAVTNDYCAGDGVQEGRLALLTEEWVEGLDVSLTHACGASATADGDVYLQPIVSYDFAGSWGSSHASECLADDDEVVFIGSPSAVIESPVYNPFAFFGTAEDAYLWDFGDGEGAAQRVVEHTYTQAGTYAPSLTYRSGWGSPGPWGSRWSPWGAACEEVSTSVLGAQPTAGFHPATTTVDLADAATVAFTDQSTDALGWSWDFGDGNTSTDPNPEHEFAETGTYDVTLSVSSTEYCAPDTATGTVHVIDTDTLDLVTRLDRGPSSAEGAVGPVKTVELTVANEGPGDAQGATVTLHVPPGVDTLAWVCAPSAAASCPTSGTGVLDVEVDIPAEESVTFTVELTLLPDTAGTTLTLAAEALAPGGMEELRPEDNANSLLLDIGAIADLAVTLQSSAPRFLPGAPATFTLSVENQGPSDTTEAALEVVLDDAVEGVSWACQPACGAGGGAPTGSFLLAAGEARTYTLDALLDASATETVTVSATARLEEAGALDPDPANATDTLVVAMAPTVDLRVHAEGETARAGAPLSVSVTVANEGPHLAPGSTLSTTLTDAVDDLEWVCEPTCGAEQGLPEGFLDLGPGESRVFTITGTVRDDAEGELVLSAQVTPIDFAYAPDPEQHATTLVLPIAPADDEAASCGCSGLGRGPGGGALLPLLALILRRRPA